MTGKTDFQLGKKVNEYLLEKGVETPMTKHNNMAFDDKKRAVEASFTAIMQNLGLDLKDDSLMDTPKRIAKMYLQEIFYGLNYENFPKCTAVENKMNHNCFMANIILKNVLFISPFII